MEQIKKTDLQKLLSTDSYLDWNIAYGYIAREMLNLLPATLKVESFKEPHEQKMFAECFISEFLEKPNYEALEQIRKSYFNYPIWLMRVYVGIAARLDPNDPEKSNLLEEASKMVRHHLQQRYYPQCYLMVLLENAFFDLAMLDIFEDMEKNYIQTFPVKGSEYFSLFKEIMIKRPDAIDKCLQILKKLLFAADCLCFSEIVDTLSKVYVNCYKDKEVATKILSGIEEIFEAFATLPTQKRWADDKVSRRHTIVTVTMSLAQMPEVFRIKLLEYSIDKKSTRENGALQCKHARELIEGSLEKFAVLKEALSLYCRMLEYYPKSANNALEGLYRVAEFIAKAASRERDDQKPAGKNYFDYIDQDKMQVFNLALTKVVENCSASDGSYSHNVAILLFDTFAYADLFSFESAEKHIKELAEQAGRYSLHSCCYVLGEAVTGLDYLTSKKEMDKVQQMNKLIYIFSTTAIDAAVEIEEMNETDFSWVERMLKQNWDCQNRFAKIRDRMADAKATLQKEKDDFEALKQKVSDALK